MNDFREAEKPWYESDWNLKIWCSLTFALSGTWEFQRAYVIQAYSRRGQNPPPPPPPPSRLG